MGDQTPPFTLLIAVDDATSTVVDALFCEKEDAHSYFLLVHGLVHQLGLPAALYTDRHGVFRHTPGSGLPGRPAQFSRAMEELGIQMIFALSPQAKGRVERAAGTFQDRLVTGLRADRGERHRGTQQRAGAVPATIQSTLPGNASGFRRNTLSLHSGLSTRSCVGQVLCFKHRRKVARDNTVRFQLHTLQLLPGPERPSYAGAAVEV